MQAANGHSEAQEEGEIAEREPIVEPERKRRKLSVPSPPRDIPKAKARLRVPSPPPVPTTVEREAGKKKKSKGGAAVPGTAAGAGGSAGFVNLYDEQARPEVQIVQRGSAISVADVQALVLWALAEGQNPKWAFIKNKLLLQRVMLLMVPGIDRDLFEASRHLLTNMHTLLGEPTTVTAKSPQVFPGHTVTQLFTVPHDKKRKREEAEKAAAQPPDGRAALTAEVHAQPTPQFPISHYVLSYKDMEAYGFPLPFLDDDGGTECPPGFVSSASPEAVGAGAAEDAAGGSGKEQRRVRDMVALDCEMCYCGEVLEVTRITLLDADGKVLMDDLVLPDAPITDYNTRYSGITPEMMQGVTRTLRDAQRNLFSYMGSDTLLVGHALENDLAALRVLHSRCIDTAALYPHPKGPPYKLALRVLTERYLKRRIQTGEHDSVQDARAALDLARLKFRHGPAFGVEPLTTGDRLMDVLAAAGKSAVLVDRIEVLNRHTTGTASAIRATGDAEAATKAGKAIARAGTHFVWTQLTQLADLFERRARVKAEPAAPGGDPPAGTALGDLRERAAAHLAASASAAGSPAAAAAAIPNGTLPEPPAGSGQHLPAGSTAKAASRAPPAAVSAMLRTAPPPSPHQQQKPRGGKSAGAQAMAEAAAARPPGAGLQVPLDATLRRLDALVGQVHAALPPHTLLVLHTGQGDTAECRRLQKEKYRRQQQLDGLPPWDMASEARFAELASRVSRGLCFCTVKH